MLYITTRDNYDAHTAYKTLLSDTAQDGGLYIPFQMPVFELDELLNLKSMSFAAIVADILNRFFSAGLTAWSVECAIGRNCTKVKHLGQKIVVLEPWHNPKRTYAYLEDSLYSLIGNEKREAHSTPTNWVKIAIRIAVLFGTYSQLLAECILRSDEMFHISVRTGECVDLAAIWYAREMGLPISMTLCGDSNESGIWNLVHGGELSTNDLNKAHAMGLERLTHAAWGRQECDKLLESCQKRVSYIVSEESRPLSNDIFCTVIGNDRICNVINSVFRNYSYLIDADIALPFAAVQDYRAKTGENRLTVLIGENDPLLSADFIAGATGLPVEEIASAQKK